MKAFTVEQELIGNAIVLVIKPAKGYCIASYGSHGVKQGEVKVVISKD